jgi:hypothetical protein
MAQVDDELAIRSMLAAMTADQPPAPPARYAAVRRQAVTHRRRQLAGAAAAVAVLVAAAIAIPLGLVHIGPVPPAAPSRHYHVSELPAGTGAPRGLLATGTLNNLRWKATVQEQGDQFCWSYQVSDSFGGCTNGKPPAAAIGGPPVSFFGLDGSFDTAAARGDISYLTISYNNGQVLTVHPVAAFGPRYARVFALATPYVAAVTRITAYSPHGEIGYTVPFTGYQDITVQRWLRPAQPALPRPATIRLGSGRVDSVAWSASAYIGPWGTCFGNSFGSFFCYSVTRWTPAAGQAIHQYGHAHSVSYSIVSGETSPSVAYLILARQRQQHQSRRHPGGRQDLLRLHDNGQAPGGAVDRLQRRWPGTRLGQAVVLSGARRARRRSPGAD